MHVVILAAGEGTRMRPLSTTRPKPMLPVADRPLAAHVADAAVDAGAERLTFVVGYRDDVVREYFGTTYRRVPVSFADQGDPNGTADAVAAAAEHIDGSFVVLNGDNLYDPTALSRLFERAPAVGATRVDAPSNYGVLETTDGEVDGIVEKPADPPSNLVNVGAYVFPAEARDWLSVPESDRGEHELTDVVARMIESCRVDAVTFDEWLDVGRPWELLAATERRLAGLDRRLDGAVHPDAEVTGDVVVERGATVRAGVVIDGPAMIRAGATVGPNAFVRGTTVVGEEAKVGHAVEVKNSVLMAGATVGHLSYVGDSILGRDVNFGAGTTVANLRHDGRDVQLTVKGERVSTGRRKLGVVVGDGAKTGINASLNAGVVLSTDARTHPGETVTEDR